MKMFWFCLFVVLFSFCAKCSAISTGELEDFTNYLLESSKLDQIHSKMNPFTPYSSDDKFDDEDEPVLENAWEESGKFEGDLILNDKQRKTIIEEVTLFARNGLRDSTKKWPNNEVIYYIQTEHFNEAQVQAIEDGIEDLGRASCVKFRPYKKGDRDAVVIQGSRRGCFSQVGYQGGYQVLNLSGRHPPGRGCFRHGTVVHELLHTLGFYHMQSSPDRDDYIDVAWENIIERAKHNFRKYNTFSVSDFGVGYDYDSVLHYSKKAFSNNGQDTLIPKQSGVEIGQRTGLSDKDSQKLNKMYCDSDSNNNEADESTNLRLPAKKKEPKNIPFKGQGIGYHQGKKVVIKLPASDKRPQSKISPYSTSDYFSKVPSSTSTTGFGVVKEVEHDYDSWYKLGPEFNKDISKVKKSLYTDFGKQIEEQIEEPIVRPNKKYTNEDGENGKNISKDTVKREDLVELLDKLKKIIKTLPNSLGFNNDPKYENIDSNTQSRIKTKTLSEQNTNNPEAHVPKKSDSSIKKVNKFFNGLHAQHDYGSFGTAYPFKYKYNDIYNEFKYVPQYSKPQGNNGEEYINYQDDGKPTQQKRTKDIDQKYNSDDFSNEDIWDQKNTFEGRTGNKDETNVAIKDTSDNKEGISVENTDISYPTFGSHDWYRKESSQPYSFPTENSSRESHNSEENLNEKLSQYKSPNANGTNDSLNNYENNLVPDKIISNKEMYSYSSESSEKDEGENGLIKPLNYKVTENIDEISEKPLRKLDKNNREFETSKDYILPSVLSQSSKDKLDQILKEHRHFDDFDKNSPFEKVQFYSSEH